MAYPIKSGARHSKTDQEHLDAAYRHLSDAGANPPAPPASAQDQRVAEATAETAGAKNMKRKQPTRYAGTKSVNLTELIDQVRDAWEDLFETDQSIMPMPAQYAPWIQTIFDDAIIICADGGDLYKVTYTVANGVYTFAPQSQWQEVRVSYVPASEPEPEGMAGKSLGSELVAFGSALKSLGNGHYGGDLVVFSDPKRPDLTGQYFDVTTDFGLPADGTPLKTAVYFNHRQPLPTKSGDYIVIKDQIGEGELTKKDNSIFIDMVLYNAKRYEEYLSVMGLSSGTAEHLIEVEPAGKAEHIKRWPLGLDASLTPTPAEPDTRARIVPLKSLPNAPELKALLQAGNSNAGMEMVAAASSRQGVNNMPEGTQAATDNAAMIAALNAHTEALKAYNALQTPKPGTPGSGVAVSAAGVAGMQVGDVVKTPYKSIKAGGFGDYLADVMRASQPGAAPSDRLRIMTDERKAAIKASGSNETVPSEGGWLTQVDHENEFLRLTYDSGVLSSRCNRRSLGAGFNGTTVYGRDETSRATGSRWGGVQGYRLGEAGTITASKPQFRKIELKLKKFAVAAYATDELLADTTLLEQEVMDSAPKELAFMTDDDIMNGAGVAGPVGYLNSPAVISVAAEAGQAASTILFQNIVKMWSRRWGANAANYVALSVGVGGVPVFLPPTGLSTSPYATLFNRPVIPTEFNPGLGSVGDIQLVDLSQYKLIDKGGVQSASSIHVQFLTDETVFRFIYRVDGQPIWSKPLTPYKTNTSTTFSPFITLAAR
jgi:HK97 family phage major capsid protein